MPADHVTRRPARSRVPATLWSGLQRLLVAASLDQEREGHSRPDVLHVVDLGGGTGGLAVRVAGLGHRVTVVDPSPDALAALQRRAAEAGLAAAGHPGGVAAVQGDADTLGDLLAPGSADVVLCHVVLEVVDDAPAALGAVRTVLRPGGRLSLLLTPWPALVLARTLGGQFSAAQRVLEDPDRRSGPQDPLRRRLDVVSGTAMLRLAGFEDVEAEGSTVLADLVPSALAEADPGTVAALERLELALSRVPELVAVASSVHLRARRP